MRLGNSARIVCSNALILAQLLNSHWVVCCWLRLMMLVLKLHDEEYRIGLGISNCNPINGLKLSNGNITSNDQMCAPLIPRGWKLYMNWCFAHAAKEVHNPNITFIIIRKITWFQIFWLDCTKITVNTRLFVKKYQSRGYLHTEPYPQTKLKQEWLHRQQRWIVWEVAGVYIKEHQYISLIYLGQHAKPDLDSMHVLWQYKSCTFKWLTCVKLYHILWDSTTVTLAHT